MADAHAASVYFDCLHNLNHTIENVNQCKYSGHYENGFVQVVLGVSAAKVCLVFLLSH